MSRYEKMADEIYEDAVKGGAEQQNDNPFASIVKEYLNSITQALYNDMMNKLKQSLPQPVKKPDSGGNSYTPTSNEIFKGDE